MQQDALHAVLTPRENLMFSATLRLPPSTLRSVRAQRVEAILEELGLMVHPHHTLMSPLYAVSSS